MPAKVVEPQSEVALSSAECHTTSTESTPISVDASRVEQISICDAPRMDAGTIEDVITWMGYGKQRRSKAFAFTTTNHDSKSATEMSLLHHKSKRRSSATATAVTVATISNDNNSDARAFQMLLNFFDKKLTNALQQRTFPIHKSDKTKASLELAKSTSKSINSVSNPNYSLWFACFLAFLISASVFHVLFIADIPPSYCRSPWHYYLNPDCFSYT
ncbi:unnamed protein product [Notodromas monacha]|uniref:Uncharacterized protein n=1 Tax=Notodromas monacha TaxID=399045 RepID=A0A7R9BZS3_9CRUS|nr:unnamed protein product [Notodromas monacha]CAG0924769.1 unnamed protein product [Notodromas monacha]